MHSDTLSSCEEFFLHIIVDVTCDALHILVLILSFAFHTMLMLGSVSAVTKTIACLAD